MVQFESPRHPNFCISLTWENSIFSFSWGIKELALPSIIRGTGLPLTVIGGYRRKIVKDFPFLKGNRKTCEVIFGPGAFQVIGVIMTPSDLRLIALIVLNDDYHFRQDFSPRPPWQSRQSITSTARLLLPKFASTSASVFAANGRQRGWLGQRGK